MQNIVWTKALINAYFNLNEELDKCDRDFDRYVNSLFQSSANAEGQMNQLYCMVRNKKALQFAKDLFGKMMTNTQLNEKSPVMLRYGRLMKYDRISEICKLNIRTVYRKVEEELNILCIAMKNCGINNMRCDELWGGLELFKVAINDVTKIERNQEKKVITTIQIDTNSKPMKKDSLLSPFSASVLELEI